VSCQTHAFFTVLCFTLRTSRSLLRIAVKFVSGAMLAAFADPVE
jgi:hypothetical protein